jgi:hypothetical protein
MIVLFMRGIMNRRVGHLWGIHGEMAKIPQVKAIYWFPLRDMDKSVCGGEDSMGLISTNGRRKPAFAAFVKAATK